MKRCKIDPGAKMAAILERLRGASSIAEISKNTEGGTAAGYVCLPDGSPQSEDIGRPFDFDSDKHAATQTGHRDNTKLYPHITCQRLL